MLPGSHNHTTKACLACLLFIALSLPQPRVVWNHDVSEQMFGSEEGLKSAESAAWRNERIHPSPPPASKNSAAPCFGPGHGSWSPLVGPVETWPAQYVTKVGKRKKQFGGLFQELEYM